MLIASLLNGAIHNLRTAPAYGLAIIFLSLTLTYLVGNEIVRFKARLAGIPGPRGYPVAGNLPQLRGNNAEQYRKWAKQYGPVFQVQLGNIPVLVVNSAAAAKQIFGGHSNAVASRPEMYTFHKLVSNTAGTTIGTSPYDESLKRRRKGAASALNRPSVETYIDHLDLETRGFLAEAMNKGKEGTVAIDPLAICQRLALSLALTLNWGTRIASSEDNLFKEITHVEIEISRFRSTTDNLQDYIPFLRLNPFSAGQKKAAEYRARRDAYLGRFNRDLADKVEKGIHKPCIQANVMLDKEARLNDVELMSISLTILSGGFETFSTNMQWSIGLLATRPDIQQKAYKAIQDHYGSGFDPLCDPYDDQKCGYVAALVRECLRYFSVLRLSLPRATNQSFVHEGKVVPNGTAVFLNTWACNHDGELWEDPQNFRPERWLEHPDHPMFTYGLGYRMCAGSLLANRELYLTFLRMISCFEITTTERIDIDPLSGVDDLTSLVSPPKPYSVSFKPRDTAALREALKGVDA